MGPEIGPKKEEGSSGSTSEQLTFSPEILVEFHKIMEYQKKGKGEDPTSWNGTATIDSFAEAFPNQPELDSEKGLEFLLANLQTSTQLDFPNADGVVTLVKIGPEGIFPSNFIEFGRSNKDGKLVSIFVGYPFEARISHYGGSGA